MDTPVSSPWYSYNKRWYSYSEQSPTITERLSNRAVGSGAVRKIGSSVPDWKQKIQKGVDASSAYIVNGWEFQPVPLTAKTVVDYGTYKSYAFCKDIMCGDLPNLDGIVDPGLSDLALKRLKRRLSSASGAMNSVIPAAELKDLRETIHGSIDLTFSLLKTLITIKRSKGKSALKYASKAWLTYNFGISPLISDTKNILESIAAYLLRNDHTCRLTATASKQWVTSTSDNYILNGYSEVHWRHTINHLLSYKYIGAFELLLESANNYSIADHLGLKLPSLIPTAWELVPFTWVLDYFGTVGDFLDDTFCSPPGNTKFLVLCRRYTADIDTQLWHVPTSGAKLLYQTTAHTKAKFFEFQRSVLSSLPHLAIRIRSRDEIGIYGVSKLLNLASVLLH